MKKISLLVMVACIATSMQAQKTFKVSSPDGKLVANVSIGKQQSASDIVYDIEFQGNEVLSPSPIALTLTTGEVWGKDARLQSAKRGQINQEVPMNFYRAATVKDECNTLTLNFKKNWSIEFRAYNDGVAYRFVSNRKDSIKVQSETLNYVFPKDYTATLPYVRKGPEKDGKYAEQYRNSFENIYTTSPISQLNRKRIAFLPLIVDAEVAKICFTEANLEGFPGLYLKADNEGRSLEAMHAPYPKRVKQGGHNELQLLVQETEDYIAKVGAGNKFPWRIAIVAKEDKDIAASNLNYILAEPSRLTDISWIKPGKVAWDWWNDWNISGVDFRAGINNDTYKYYIDFASSKGIEYVILDEGWAVNKKADLMQVVPEIDLKELVEYGKQRNVGIILWAGYYAFLRDMDNVVRYFSELGVKGFKVDFMDRDDQLITDFVYKAAEVCAKYKMIVDFHGMFKPAGLTRTYPNVLNCEGVNGLEQLKWSSTELDQVKYDVQIPFLRQVAGPMDYTQGAMLNAIKKNYRPCSSEPMSQGTRCHQLALYVVFDSPFNMLCDSPTNYLREPECTDFIANIPTVWDDMVVLDGKLGEYIIVAHRKGNEWYIGGITDWTPRDLTVDTSFLGSGTYKATIFKDGVNADRKGTDYKRTDATVKAGEKLNFHLAPGGGFAIKLQK